MLHTFIQMVIETLFHASPVWIYLLVALFLFLESTGISVVNTTLLLLAGALVSLGHLNLWLLMASAVLGSVGGACLAYVIGERGGRKVLPRLAALLHVKEQRIVGVELWFQQSGAWMIFFARILPYIRPFACFLAGIWKLPFRRFFIAASLGSIIWCVGIIHVGVALGRHWEWGLRMIQRYTIPSILGLLLLVALFLLIKHMIKRYLDARLLKAAEEAPKDAEEAENSDDLLEVR